jgi:hypothetical protein
MTAVYDTHWPHSVVITNDGVAFTHGSRVDLAREWRAGADLVELAGELDRMSGLLTSNHSGN